MLVKKCPVCGNEPMAICYPSNPPLYGYTHCDVHGGYNKDWHEAKLKWNEQVDILTPKEKGDDNG